MKLGIMDNKLFTLIDGNIGIKLVHCDYKNKVTVVIFKDDSKTICKCSKDDVYNEELGIYICILKRIYGRKIFEKINSNKNVIYNNFNKEEK